MALDTKDLELIRDVIVDGVDAVTGPRFDAIEKRLDEHDKRFDVIEGHLDEHDKRFDTYGRRLESLEREMRENFAEVRSLLERLEGKVAALEADVKDIFAMLSRMQNSTGGNRSFQKLNLEDKLLKLNAELLAAAKQAGITLPR